VCITVKKFGVDPYGAMRNKFAQRCNPGIPEKMNRSDSVCIMEVDEFCPENNYNKAV
jgi:hypothetical protein